MVSRFLEEEIHVLQCEANREAAGPVALIHHRRTVRLVERRGKQRLGEDVEQSIRGKTFHARKVERLRRVSRRVIATPTVPIDT